MTLPVDLKSRLKPQYFVILTFAIMLFASWRRWTSMIVDIGRETDLPFRIMNGEMLYRDIHYIYPPFSPYFNALLYRVFGVHLDTLIFSGILFTILLTFLCYKIARKIMPATGASIAVSFIVVLCFFKPAGNLILSYSFAGVHAAVFALAAILFTLHFAERRNKRDLIIAGIFIGLAGITKQEFAFASAAAATAYLIYLHRLNFAALLVDLMYTAIPAIVIGVPVFAVLFANIDWRILIDDCHLFYTNIPESLIFYNRFRSGLNYPFGSFIQMIGAAAVSVAFVVAIIIFSDRTGKLRPRLVAVFAISASIVSIVLYFFISDWDGSPLRALPFFLVGIIVWEWRRKSKSNKESSSKESDSHDFVFIVAVYSLVILIRVVLRVPSGGFSGSFYLPTSLILIFYALLRVLPLAIRKWTNDDRSHKRAARLTLGICIIAVVATIVSFAFRYREKFTFPIAARRGTLFAEQHSGAALSETLEFIEENTSDGEFIAVLPEGSDLAFLTGRRINFRHQVLIPAFLSEQDEQDAIAMLKKDNVRFIFIPNRAMREFGYVEFGRDFYKTLGDFIDDNYRVVRIFGISGAQLAEVGKPPFFVKVYERKGS